MESDTRGGGAFRAARPRGGDLVDRYLGDRLRARLFAEELETRLGRLTVDGVLGQGAMGAVVSAFDPVLDRHVAVKSVRAERGEDNDKLLGEAKLLATVDHRSVVEVYDVITEDGAVHIIMERIDGVTLREWMSGDHDGDEVIDLFAQLGDGLAAAHRLGIVHSDIKPENILVDGDRAVLIDFGLAFRSGERVRHGGTAAYLAPERKAGGPGSTAADQFAFLVTLREALGSTRVARRVTRAIERGTLAEPDRRFAEMSDVVRALAPARSRALLWAAGVATAAAVAATVVAVMAARSRGADPCGEAAQSVEAAWTDSTRAAVAARVDAAAVEKLDGYFAELVRVRKDSCQRTRVRGEQSDSFLDGSTRCTDDRLRGASALVTLFSTEPPARVIERAAELVDGLDELAICADADALAQRVPLPEEKAAREAIDALAGELEAAKNLERRGDFKEAAARLDDIVGRARALGYAPLAAEALLLRGSALETLGDLDAADTTFREAASAAAKARDDRRLAETWIRLLELLAKRGKHDQALALETVALASVERIPTALATRARLHNALGGIYLARADYDHAFADYQAALALQRQIGERGNRFLGAAIANLALVKWYRGDLEAAFVDQKEALEVMIRELGPDHAHVAYAHQNLGDLAQRLGPEEKAIAPHHFREAMRIWSASLGADHVNLAYPLEQLASFALADGDIKTARRQIRRALSLREAAYGADHVLVLQANPDAPIQIALTGHYDTVFSADSAFQDWRMIDEDTINGPGVADMKGGILVMATALAALERHPKAAEVGYTALISPDEEIGSQASAPVIAEIGAEAHAGMTYEPALADGGLAGARKGSGNFTLIVRGRAAHAGREHYLGRNAIEAAARFAVGVQELNGERDGVTFNVGKIDGGGPTNVVPALAVCRFNVRLADPADTAWIEARVRDLVKKTGAADGIAAELRGGFTRPPKPMAPANAAMFDYTKAAGAAIGIDVFWNDTGGVCEGNNLWAAGCPNVDTLGVRGGDIHSPNEFAVLSSFPERAKLSAVMLMGYATGAFNVRRLRSV